MFDLLIKNGTIINGTGSPSFFGDVGITEGKIVRIGKGLTGAKKTIDATGLTVTPGFIDSHSHSDNAILSHPEMIEKLEQGITTSISGQCGGSPAPISRDATQEEKDKIVGGIGKAGDVLRTFGTFLDAIKDRPMGESQAILVGHGNLRKAVMGMENRAPSADELEQMKALLREALEHGALGVSFGLIYPPSCYAETDELIEIAKVAQEYYAIVAAHIRGEGGTLTAATAEFIQIIRESGARGVLSHHKAAGGKENWGKVHNTLRMLEAANAEGLEIWCDTYPYTATHTSMGATFIPTELHAGGDAGIVQLLADPEERKKLKAWGRERWGDDLSWTQVVACDAYPQYKGLFMPEIAKLHGTDAYDAIYDMIAACGNQNCNACYHTICEEDVATVLAWPRTMVCTDASAAKGSTVFHPRLKGSFPRVLGRFVREKGVTSLPEMIRKMTSMPASVYGLKTKGLIWEGMDADLCIFDADKIIDRSEFTNCNQRAEGLNYVIVAGEVVVEDAVCNGKKLGRVLLMEH